MGIDKLRNKISRKTKIAYSSVAYNLWKSNPVRRAGSARRILLIDALLPDPTFGAGFPRAAEIVRALVAGGWRVAIYPMHAEAAHYAACRREFPVGVEFIPSHGSRGLLALLKARAPEFGAVVVSRPEPMQAYADIVAAHPPIHAIAPCVYDAEALAAHREILRRELTGQPMSDVEQAQALQAELDLGARARAVWAVTRAEAATFARLLHIPAFVVGHGLPTRTDAPGPAGRADLLFVGRTAEFQSPNVDSLIWFVERVMPALDALVGGDYRLRIVGLAGDEVRARLASRRVVFEGVVRDTRPVYDRCRLFVAPTRFAAGLPLKVCEAMAMGLPCVATDLLVGQAELTAGHDVESASRHDPAAFAQGCARLLADDAHWRRIQQQALATGRARFSVDELHRSVVRAVSAIASPGDAA